MKNNRFLILMYHMISAPLSEPEKKYACPPEFFDKHLRFIRDNYKVISLDDVARYQKLRSPMPENSLVITLDDGFEDNFINAYPILKKYEIPATIFLTAGMLGNKNQWMSCRGFPERRLLSWDQVKQMQGLIDFGAHTVNHVRLSETSTKTARKEILDSKSIIEDNLGLAVKHFAYPYGMTNNNVTELVKEAGFESACSTRSGFNNKDMDLFNLRRIEIFGNDPVWKVRQKLLFGTNKASRLYPLQYYSTRILAKLGLRQ